MVPNSGGIKKEGSSDEEPSEGLEENISRGELSASNVPKRGKDPKRKVLGSQFYSSSVAEISCATFLAR